MSKVLVIDSDNYSAAGIETLFFPGGEPHAKIPVFNGYEKILFFLKPRTWNDTGIGACVWDALNQQNLRRGYDLILFMPYFPGARQDKTDGTAPLTKEMVESMFLASNDTYTFDIHSGWNTNNFMPSDLDIPIKKDVVGIIAPDKGATYRADDFRNSFYPNAHFVQCSKVRDPHTGKLSNYHCPDLPAKGKYIIVDDICDGGGTFNLLADAFFKAKFGQKCTLELFVSHGIFSKGVDAIDRRIEHITTTDSWRVRRNWYSDGDNIQENGRLTVLSLQPIIDKILED
jgi:ribose-phosphate pyrophosphokinase